MNFITVLVSGLCGLLVAIVTWKLAGMREKRKFKQEILYKDYKDKESFYTDLLASIHKIIRLTKEGKDYVEIDQMSVQTAKTTLIGAASVTEKLEIVADNLQKWIIEYRKGMPRRLGDTNFVFVSSQDDEHIQKANNLYPGLHKAIYELGLEIKDHLKGLKNDLVKSKL